MGNEVSEMAADAAVEAVVDGANIDVDVDLDINIDDDGGQGPVEELQRSFGTLNLDEIGADDHADVDEDVYYDEHDVGDYDHFSQDQTPFIAPEEYYGAYPRGSDIGTELFDVNSDALEEEFDDGVPQANQPGFALNLSDEEYALEADEEEFDVDQDGWDDVEIGETEEGLFEEDISVLRNDVSLLGDGGLDLYEGVEPVELIDWEWEEFYWYDLNDLSTATDIELTSLGYPPEPIFGTSTEDIMFSYEMMQESTVPPATYSPQMVEAAQELADTSWEMADSIRDMRLSLL